MTCHNLPLVSLHVIYNHEVCILLIKNMCMQILRAVQQFLSLLQHFQVPGPPLMMED